MILQILVIYAKHNLLKFILLWWSESNETDFKCYQISVYFFFSKISCYIKWMQIEVIMFNKFNDAFVYFSHNSWKFITRIFKSSLLYYWILFAMLQITKVRLPSLYQITYWNLRLNEILPIRTKEQIFLYPDWSNFMQSQHIFYMLSPQNHLYSRWTANVRVLMHGHAKIVRPWNWHIPVKTLVNPPALRSWCRGDAAPAVLIKVYQFEVYCRYNRESTQNILLSPVHTFPSRRQWHRIPRKIHVWRYRLYTEICEAVNLDAPEIKSFLNN